MSFRSVRRRHQKGDKARGEERPRQAENCDGRKRDEREKKGDRRVLLRRVTVLAVIGYWVDIS